MSLEIRIKRINYLSRTAAGVAVRKKPKARMTAAREAAGRVDALRHAASIVDVTLINV